MEGIERLKKMLEGQKDKYLNIIVNHLMLQTEMNDAFLNEEKNLKDMATYIKDTARKKASNGVAVIEDEVVFKWAKDYFIKSNEELGIKKKEVKSTETTIKDNNKTDDEFGSIFDVDNNSDTKNDKKEINQISLFTI